MRAETGSGKTLSYIAPLFSKIGGILPRVTRNEGTRGLVLVPARLAARVEDGASRGKTVSLGGDELHHGR